MSNTVEVHHGEVTVLFDDATVGGQSIGTFLRRGEFYEARMLEYIRLLGIPGVYVDAGAAVGTHTLFFAMVCHAEHVHSFEARGWVCDLLQKNVDANGLGERVSVHRVGLADAVGTASVVLDSATAIFSTVPLDDVVTGPVAVIKIDVEDMEPRVIDGAAGILHRDRPLVFAEARNREMFAQLCATMAKHGYAPTGRYFNDTPTFEFAPPLDKRARHAYEMHAVDAYTQSGPHHRPAYEYRQIMSAVVRHSAMRRRTARLVERAAPQLAARVHHILGRLGR